MMEKEYREATEWLYNQAPNYQIDGKKAYKPGLENITKLCDFFGNPQNKLKCIHIGGTNGKGSTSNMLASVLQEAGFKVGLYTSPHLIDFTERIKINGKNCDREFVVDFVEKLKKLPNDIRPSFFEFTTIMAFEYFYQNKVDFAIIEVGLGGRLDSTNIINPIITAITNVSIDHSEILGDTIEKIALEKAGIIKENIPVICGDENENVKKIIFQKSLEKHSEFTDATILNIPYQSDLKGNYQSKNIKVVAAIVENMREANVEITEENLRQGLNNVQKNTNFMGRWFVFSKEPLIICDTAHNHAGLELVFSQLNTIPKRKHVILGFVKEKKIDEVLKILPENSVFYFAKPYVNRGRDPKDYEYLLQQEKINYKIFDDLQTAYLSAKQNVKTDEMIFVGGSNFIVGEFLEKNLEK